MLVDEGDRTHYFQQVLKLDIHKYLMTSQWDMLSNDQCCKEFRASNEEGVENSREENTKEIY